MQPKLSRKSWNCLDYCTGRLTEYTDAVLSVQLIAVGIGTVAFSYLALHANNIRRLHKERHNVLT
jgi:hypothetical protein